MKYTVINHHPGLQKRGGRQRKKGRAPVEPSKKQEKQFKAYGCKKKGQNQKKDQFQMLGGMKRGQRPIQGLE